MTSTPNDVETDLGEVTITREFDASREVLFRAFMEPEQFVQIWGPAGTHTPLETVVIEPRAGGRFESVMVTDDGTGEFPFQASFVEVVEPERFAFQVNGSSMVSTSTFDDLGNGRTRITVKQTRVEPIFRDAENLKGFDSSLDKVDVYIASLPATAAALPHGPSNVLTTGSEGIRISRTFDAPIDAVFAAWTTPEHFAVWWGGPEVTVPLDSVEMDVRVGGKWKATMQLPDGNEMHWNGEYTELDAPNRLVTTLTDGSGPGFESCSVTLTADGSRTAMVFTQTGGHMDAAGYAGAGHGWAIFMDTMASIFAK